MASVKPPRLSFEHLGGIIQERLYLQRDNRSRLLVFAQPKWWGFQVCPLSRKLEDCTTTRNATFDEVCVRQMS